MKYIVLYSLSIGLCTVHVKYSVVNVGIARRLDISGLPINLVTSNFNAVSREAAANKPATCLVNRRNNRSATTSAVMFLVIVLGFLWCDYSTITPGSVAAGLTESISPATSWISLASMARSLARSWLILMKTTSPLLEYNSTENSFSMDYLCFFNVNATSS